MFKACKDGVLVDVIFRSARDILLDGEMLRRARPMRFRGRRVPVAAPEDLVVMKAQATGEETPRYWYDALAILARDDLDWGYLVSRARQHGSIGIAGVKGFGGGFAGAHGTEFGEPEMKAFIRHTKDRADALEGALGSLRTTVRIALTHYSPVRDTLQGEPPEIFPFLGSYLLAEAIDRAGADLAIHGHAHRGVEHGVTAAGVNVRNVAQTVIRTPYAVYTFEGTRSGVPETTASGVLGA